MRIPILIGLATLFSSGLASPASAQIISTMMPTQRPSGQPAGGAATGGGTRPVTFHVMGGYTQWRFQGLEVNRDEDAQFGGTTTGGRNGYIGAADVAFAMGENISVGAGGWANTVENMVVTRPARPGFVAFTDTLTIAAYSGYANVFYKHFGVQAGVVPFKADETFERSDGIVFPGNLNQTDIDVFGVGRFGSADRTQRPWSAMVGAGLYRYGSREADVATDTPESPAANAFTTFVNGSVGIYKGLSLDLSFWYTAKDKNYGDDSPIGNGSQTRLTVGVGYGR